MRSLYPRVSCSEAHRLVGLPLRPAPVTPSSSESGRQVSEFCAFTPLRPPGLRLFHGISIYINVGVPDIF